MDRRDCGRGLEEFRFYSQFSAMDFLSLITPRTGIPSLQGPQYTKYSGPFRDVAFPKKALIKGARAFRKTPMQLD